MSTIEPWPFDYSIPFIPATTLHSVNQPVQPQVENNCEQIGMLVERCQIVTQRIISALTRSDPKSEHESNFRSDGNEFFKEMISDLGLDERCGIGSEDCENAFFESNHIFIFFAQH